MLDNLSYALINADCSVNHKGIIVNLEQGSFVLINYFLKDSQAYNIYTEVDGKLAEIYPIKEKFLTPFNESNFSQLEGDSQHDFVSLKIIKDYLESNQGKR